MNCLKIQEAGFFENVNNTQYQDYYDLLSEITGSMIGEADNIEIFMSVDDKMLYIYGNEGGLDIDDIKRLTEICNTTGNKGSSAHGQGLRQSANELVSLSKCEKKEYNIYSHNDNGDIKLTYFYNKEHKFCSDYKLEIQNRNRFENNEITFHQK